MSTLKSGRARDPVVEASTATLCQEGGKAAVARRRARVLALFETGMKPKRMLAPVRAEFGEGVSLVAVHNDIKWLRARGAIATQNGANLDRQCLELRKAGHSFGGIAEQLGISRSAVSGRLFRMTRRERKAASQSNSTTRSSGAGSSTLTPGAPEAMAVSHANRGASPMPDGSPAPSAGRPRCVDTAVRTLNPDVSAAPLCSDNGQASAQRGAAVGANSSPYPPGAPTAVMTAKPGTCRWPIGEPRDADFRFCGATAMDGSSWCTNHADRARPDVTAHKGAS